MLKFDKSYNDLQVSIAGSGEPWWSSNTPSWTTFDFNISGGIAFNVLGFGVGEFVGQGASSLA